MRAFSFLKLIITLFLFFFDLSSLRTADVFPVVASLPSKNNACEPEGQNDFRERYFSEGEKRRPEIRLRFAGYDLSLLVLCINCAWVVNFCLSKS